MLKAAMKRVFITDEALPLSRVKYYLVHELAGHHVARAVEGERSPLGLLGVGPRNYMVTEEGWALYLERRDKVEGEQPFGDWGIWLATLTTGLAMGIITPPQTFRRLFHFLKRLYLLRYLLEYADRDIEKASAWAEDAAFISCWRVFRGVPDLDQAGVCFSKDAVYMHGLHLIEQVVAQDTAILDRLTLGKVALEDLPILEDLGFATAPQSLRELANRSDLDSHILSLQVKE